MKRKKGKRTFRFMGGPMPFDFNLTEARKSKFAVEAVQGSVRQKVIHMLEDVSGATLDVIARHLHIPEVRIKEELYFLQRTGIIDLCGEERYSLNQENLNKTMSLVDDLAKA